MATSFVHIPRRPAAHSAATKRGLVFVAQAGICLLIPATIRPQTPLATQTLKFEVASIRPVPDDRFPKVFYMSPAGSNEFIARNVTVGFLLSWAYGLIDARQVPHEPAWLYTANWDILAKPEGSTPPNEETLKLLVQQLLRDRFHLACHTRTEVDKGYLLVTTKESPKLTKTEGGLPDASTSSNGVDVRIHVRNSPLSGLAAALTTVLHQPVVDRTGLDGSYDVSLRVASPQSTESAAPSIFSVIGDLGLKLEKADVPLKVLVIDHIDSSPTEN